MFSSADKTTKSVNIARKQASGQTFFRKAGEDSFFGAKEQGSFFAGIQPKLTVSQPDDPYEKEADAVAETVMRMPASAPSIATKEEDKLQRQEEEEEMLQPKLIGPEISSIQRQAEEEEETVQAKTFEGIQRQWTGFAGGDAEEVPSFDSLYSIQPKHISLYPSDVIQCSGRGPPAPSIQFQSTLESSKGGGTALPDTTRSFMEQRFQADFSGVRIHTGSYAEGLSTQVHAQAFTHGNDIYFNSGKFSPNTAAGGTLLAHELTHTIQQGASKNQTNNSPSVSRKLIQRVAQLDNAVNHAKSMIGKVNAKQNGPDGYRIGWEHLVEFFKTTMGEDKVVPAGAPFAPGTVNEMVIKKYQEAKGMVPNQERPSTSNTYMRDAMPSWCGIFAFWALNKGGVPMPKWILGGRVVTPESARAPGEMPHPGDIAYIDKNSHFALVEKTDGTNVSTVNGNTSGEDNLGAQVQVKDHPISHWKAFFDPIKLKTGELTEGEAVAGEKSKSLRQLREEMFHVYAKGEDDKKDEEPGTEVQAKPELSNWEVNSKGQLHNASPKSSTQSAAEVVQAKEEEKKPDEESGTTLMPSLQKKYDAAIFCKEEPCDCKKENVQAKYESPEVGQYNETSLESYTNPSTGAAAMVNDRGPPVISRSPQQVQRSVIDDALSAIGISGILDCVEVTDFDATSACLLRKAQQVALNIPGYRALRVVLGEDPITGQHIDRNGRNFIEAAFDIMPGGRNLHQKLEEQHQLDAAAAWIDTQIGRIESLVDGLLGSFAAFWDRLGISDLTSPLDVMRDGANIVLRFIDDVIDFAVSAATELLAMVKEFLLSHIVDFIKEHTTAYPLLTVILGRDPVTEETVDRNGTNILNALLDLGGEEGDMQRQQMIETGTFQKVVDYIDEGIAVFSGAYEEIVAAFHNIWNEVTIDALMDPVGTFERIYNQFAGPVERVWNFVREVATAILNFIKEVLLQRLSAWAREQRGYELVTVIIGKDPFTDEVVPRNVTNIIRGFMSLMPGGREQFQQLQESGVIARATARINAAVESLGMTPASILQLFIDLWNSFSLSDLANPIAAFMRIIERFGEPIARLIAFVWQIIKIVIELILQAMNFPFDLINNIIARARAAIDDIKRDPVGFLKNLLRAIKQGFIQFFDNIVTHLIGGVTGWLMSELRDANVPIPTDFTLQGVISWVLEVLGISMEAIWQKLAEHPRVGPERVARIRGMIDRLEGIWTFIQDVRERGMAAIWERIQEQLSNLWDTVLDAVKNWIMEQIINRVTARLLSMLDPTGIMAVINSAIAIYNAVQSFIRYLREMLEVINSFVNGVADIAAGNVTTAANYLERTMGQAMPIVIGFLANQVGLSGVGRRIAEIIGSVRAMVDRALTWLVDRAVNMGMNILDRVMAMGGSIAGAVAGWLGLRKEVRVREGETHSLYFDENNKRLMMQSDPVVFRSFLNSIVIPTHKQSQLNPKKAEIMTSLNQLDSLIANTTLAEDTKQQQIQALLEVLGPDVAELIRETSGFSLRSEEPQYGGLHGGFGSSMRVRVVDGSPATNGSGPTMQGGNWDVLKLRQTSANRNDSFYVRAHLLNDNLGGPGNMWENLSVLSQRANNRDWYGSGSHETAVESRLKGPLSQPGKAFIYVVTANYGRSRNTALINMVDSIIDYKNNQATQPPSLPAEHAHLEALSVPELTTTKNVIDAEQFVPTAFICTIREIDASTGDEVSDSDHNINRSITNDIGGTYWVR